MGLGQQYERVKYLNVGTHVLEYTPASPNATDLIVPCVRRNYDENIDFSSMTLARAPVSEVHIHILCMD